MTGRSYTFLTLIDPMKTFSALDLRNKDINNLKMFNGLPLVC